MFSFIWVLSFYSCIFQPLLTNDKSKSQKTNVNINPKIKKEWKIPISVPRSKCRYVAAISINKRDQIKYCICVCNNIDSYLIVIVCCSLSLSLALCDWIESSNHGPRKQFLIFSRPQTHRHLHPHTYTIHTHTMIPYVVRRRPAKLFLINDFFFHSIFSFLSLSFLQEARDFCGFLSLSNANSAVQPELLLLLYCHIVFALAASCLCSADIKLKEKQNKQKMKTNRKTKLHSRFWSV